MSVLTDVMGTTTDAGFVKKLVADAADSGEAFLADISLGTPADRALIRRIMDNQGYRTAREAVQYIAGEVGRRNFDPAYMAFMGGVSANGFAEGRLVLPVFDDVAEALPAWVGEGRGIAVYSNGSIDSQRRQFKNTSRGNLAPHISRYFDTAEVGGKYEPDSYRRIADALQRAPQDIMFLSDLLQELDAADAAGYPVSLVKRPGNKPIGPAQEGKYPTVESFLDVAFPR